MSKLDLITNIDDPFGTPIAEESESMLTSRSTTIDENKSLELTSFPSPSLDFHGICTSSDANWSPVCVCVDWCGVDWCCVTVCVPVGCWSLAFLGQEDSSCGIRAWVALFHCQYVLYPYSRISGHCVARSACFEAFVSSIFGASRKSRWSCGHFAFWNVFLGSIIVGNKWVDYIFVLFCRFWVMVFVWLVQGKIQKKSVGWGEAALGYFCNCY